jgi:23S rRNA pseudouridine1911/1915/1917 synthase
MRLDRRLRALRSDLSWRRIRELIARGQVTVSGRIVRDDEAEVDEAHAIAIEASRPALPYARLSLERLYEDAEILVIDKPAGLLTIASEPSRRETDDTVLARAQKYARHLHGRRGYAGVLHRLDRETSGALALALTREAHAAGRELFAKHRFERWYLAIVEGVPADDRGTIDAPVSRAYADGRRRLVEAHDEGRRAVTHFRVRERLAGAALVELRLETGRQHQIRLHLERLGHPLIGEKVYIGAAGATGAMRGGVSAVRRQMLHAWRLAFPHPLRRDVIQVEAPLPDDFERLLAQLRRKLPRTETTGRAPHR